MKRKPFTALVTMGVEKRYQGLYKTGHDTGYFKIKCFNILGVLVYIRSDYDSEAGVLGILSLVLRQFSEDGLPKIRFFEGVKYDIIFDGVIRWNQPAQWVYWHQQTLWPLEVTVTNIVSIKLRGK